MESPISRTRGGGWSATGSCRTPQSLGQAVFWGAGMGHRLGGNHDG